MTRTNPLAYKVIVIATRQVIAVGLTKRQAKCRCREWNRTATVETWASITAGQVNLTGGAA